MRSPSISITTPDSAALAAEPCPLTPDRLGAHCGGIGTRTSRSSATAAAARWSGAAVMRRCTIAGTQSVKRSRARHLSAQPRQFQVHVRVDQRRQQRVRAEIDQRRVVAERERGAGATGGGDATVVDGDPPVEHRAGPRWARSQRERTTINPGPGRVPACPPETARRSRPARRARVLSPSARALARLSMRGTSRSRKMGLPSRSVVHVAPLRR